MTQYLTLARRPVLLPPHEAPPRPAPRMTWAEMARAEGHRKGLPPCPLPLPTPREKAARVLAYLVRHGPSRRKTMQAHCNLGANELDAAIDWLTDHGLIRGERGDRGPFSYRATEAGRGQVAG